MMDKNNLGLLRILLEQAPSTCPCRKLSKMSKDRFKTTDDAYNQKLAPEKKVRYTWPPVDDTVPEADMTWSFDELIIGSSSGSALKDHKGKKIKDFTESILDKTFEITLENTDVLCDLRTLINKIKNEESHGLQTTLNEWSKKLCALAIELWTEDVATGVEDVGGWYLFTYQGGRQSPQVNNIFRKAVMNELGLDDYSRNSNECVADVKIHFKARDKYVNGIRVSTYDGWDGFKVQHKCVPTSNTYYLTSLDITKLPDNLYQRVEDHNMDLLQSPEMDRLKSSENIQGSSSEVSQNISVSSSNDNDNDEGLGTVISQQTTQPYPDITFL